MSSEAADLLKTLAQDFGHGYGVGSMSCSVYDTAWISCISKASQVGPRQWLFPSSFLFILHSQHADGGWHWPPQGAYECADGTILSSLAALFAITQHIKQPLQLSRLQVEIDDHLKRGIEFVARVLSRFGSVHYYSVGFDVLVPALLELLEKQGIIFHFPARQKLLCRREAKLSRVSIGQLDEIPSTMLHSLEAFYGDMHFPFDSLRNRLVYGSMMASPSATAAYLMRCSEWDDSAEAYLRLMLSNGAGQSSGAAPSAFPSTNFELTWVASTLLKAGCVKSDLFAGNDGQILEVFEKRIPENGLVGFAPGIQPDVDDSANASIVLSLLGSQGLSRQMRKQFETKSHFETYKSESSDSLSANCNVLLALLLDLKHDPDAVSGVEKVSKYLATKFLSTNGPVKDKWNVSEYYSTMLLAQSFMKLIKCWEACELPKLNEVLLHDQIILVAFRSLVRILRTQNRDGSWGSRGPREETAYAILALVELAGLPMALFFDQQIHSGIHQGQNYLKAHRLAGKPEYLWVEKVLYGAENLSRAYILAALHATKSPPMDGHRIRKLLNMNYNAMAKFADFLHKVPLLASQPQWLIFASWIEGQMFLPMLNEVRRAAFSRARMTKDKYFSWIPVMWTLANNMNGCNTSASLLFDMMHVSVLNFQADEFMETVVDAEYGDDISKVRDIIESIFNSIDLTTAGEQVQAPGSMTKTQLPNGSAHARSLLATTAIGSQTTKEAPVSDTVSTSARDVSSPLDATPDLQSTCNGQEPAPPSSQSSISQSLRSFISYINGLAATAHVPLSSRLQIRAELKAFLYAHLTQIQLNREFSAQKRATAPSSSTAPPIYHNPELPFRTWLHATAAVHTSCPYSFALYLVLASTAHGIPLLSTASQRYVAEDLCGHLARMCRLYNDHGSLKRDLAEENLNSVNFPEFWEQDMSADSSSAARRPAGGGKDEAGSALLKEEEVLKERLMVLAEWERRGVERAMQELESSSFPQTDTRLMDTLKVFVDVTDLFGQVYVIKDLASTKVKT